MKLIINYCGVTFEQLFGFPAPLAGREQNWIPTVAGRAWFPLFRLYSPKQAFLDKTWVLPDIERTR